MSEGNGTTHGQNGAARHPWLLSSLCETVEATGTGDEVGDRGARRGRRGRARLSLGGAREGASRRREQCCVTQTAGKSRRARRAAVCCVEGWWRREEEEGDERRRELDTARALAALNESGGDVGRATVLFGEDRALFASVARGQGRIGICDLAGGPGGGDKNVARRLAKKLGRPTAGANGCGALQLEARLAGCRRSTERASASL